MINNILLGAVIFFYSGCEGITLAEEEVTVEEVVPQILPSLGEDVVLKSYRYPAQTLENDKNTVMDLYNYSENASAERAFVSFVERNFNATKDADDSLRVNMLDDNILVQEDVIDSNSKIISYPKDGSNISFNYPSHLAINDELITYHSDTTKTVCIVKDIVNGTQDLSSLIPEEIRTDLITKAIGATVSEDQFSYTDTMRIYCGSNDGTMRNRYYARGIGEVLDIIEKIDDTKTYVIIDQKSIEVF